MQAFLASPELPYALGALVVVILLVIVVLSRRAETPPVLEQRGTDLVEAPVAEATHVEVAKPALAPGLSRTKQGFIARLGALVGSKRIDEALLGELEEILFTADIGTRTAERLLSRVKERLAKKELMRGSAVLRALRDEAKAIFVAAHSSAKPLDLEKLNDAGKPFVILTIGVNGAGKTTTIGKLGAKLTAGGKKVLFAAGDTFRAAAAEQLGVWASRAGADLVRGKEGTDPSSVIFDGVKRAMTEGHDVVLADTAGRLQTKVELMQELQKVRRVVQKAMPDAPHETLLVLDATIGQNAISQATLFKDAVQVTGIVLTKLDGTAKGGVILGICEELRVPVRFIGIGEKVEDLRPFDPDEFVGALFDDAIAESVAAEAAQP